MSVKMNGRHLAKFVADDEFDAIFPQVSLAHETLHGKTGPGSDFLGWVDLPVDADLFLKKLQERCKEPVIL